MGKGPSVPDPYQTASAQTNANITAGAASAAMNNPDQYGPSGSRTTAQSGWQQIYDANSGKVINVPKYTETTKFSPDEQRIYGLNTQMRSNIGQAGVEQSAKLRNLLKTNLDTKGLQAWQTGAAPGQVQTSFSQGPAINRGYATKFGNAGQVRQDQAPTDRAAVERAMMSRWNQDAARTNAAQDAAMAARGLSPGSAGYGSMVQEQARARTDAVNQAYLASGEESRAAQAAYNAAQNQRYQQALGRAQFGNEAIDRLNAAQQAQWNQNLGAAQFGNAAQLQKYQMGQDYASSLNNLRTAQLQERMALRNQPINETTALLGGTQVAQPQFASFSRQGINAAPIGNYIQNAFAAQQNASQNSMSGLFGLGSAAITGLLTGL